MKSATVRRSFSCLAVFALLFLLVAARPARADGAYFVQATQAQLWRSGKLVESPKQEAILAAAMAMPAML